MDFQELADNLGEMFSEAAIEISNLDDRENIVYRRLRALQSRIRAFQQFSIEFQPMNASIDDVANALDVATDEVLERVAEGNFGVVLQDGRALSPEEFALLEPHDTAQLRLRLTFAELWQALDSNDQAQRPPALGRAGLRKFAGSETGISVASPAGDQRHG